MLSWSRVPCSSVSAPIPNAASAPSYVGDGKDYAISVSPHRIKTAIGSFPAVTGVKSVKSVNVGVGCICGKDAYSLQLNSNFYVTTNCGQNPKCVGWEQFALTSPVDKHHHFALLFIQDWRIAQTKVRLACPAKSTGWQQVGYDCFYSSRGIEVPEIPIQQLGEVTLSGSAAPNGDSVFLSDGTTVYGTKNLQGDLMDLSRYWTGAEFNVVGDAFDSLALFNAGSEITVRIEADDGSTAAPICQANKGTTGETNSLSFVPVPSKATKQQYPSILFTEADIPGNATPKCDAIGGL